VKGFGLHGLCSIPIFNFNLLMQVCDVYAISILLTETAFLFLTVMPLLYETEALDQAELAVTRVNYRGS
jgi:hypothetical protein